MSEDIKENSGGNIQVTPRSPIGSSLLQKSPLLAAEAQVHVEVGEASEGPAQVGQGDNENGENVTESSLYGSVDILIDNEPDDLGDSNRAYKRKQKLEVLKQEDAQEQQREPGAPTVEDKDDLVPRIKKRGLIAGEDADGPKVEERLSDNSFDVLMDVDSEGSEGLDDFGDPQQRKRTRKREQQRKQKPGECEDEEALMVAIKSTTTDGVADLLLRFNSTYCNLDDKSLDSFPEIANGLMLSDSQGARNAEKNSRTQRHKSTTSRSLSQDSHHVAMEAQIRAEVGELLVKFTQVFEDIQKIFAGDEIDLDDENERKVTERCFDDTLDIGVSEEAVGSSSSDDWDCTSFSHCSSNYHEKRNTEPEIFVGEDGEMIMPTIREWGQNVTKRCLNYQLDVLIRDDSGGLPEPRLIQDQERERKRMHKQELNEKRRQERKQKQEVPMGEDQEALTPKRNRGWFAAGDNAKETGQNVEERCLNELLNFLVGSGSDDSEDSYERRVIQYQEGGRKLMHKRERNEKRKQERKQKSEAQFGVDDLTPQSRERGLLAGGSTNNERGQKVNERCFGDSLDKLNGDDSEDSVVSRKRRSRCKSERERERMQKQKQYQTRRKESEVLMGEGDEAVVPKIKKQASLAVDSTNVDEVAVSDVSDDIVPLSSQASSPDQVMSESIKPAVLCSVELGTISPCSFDSVSREETLLGEQSGEDRERYSNSVHQFDSDSDTSQNRNASESIKVLDYVFPLKFRLSPEVRSLVENRPRGHVTKRHLISQLGNLNSLMKEFIYRYENNYVQFDRVNRMLLSTKYPGFQNTFFSPQLVNRKGRRTNINAHHRHIAAMKCRRELAEKRRARRNQPSASVRTNQDANRKQLELQGTEGAMINVGTWQMDDRYQKIVPKYRTITTHEIRDAQIAQFIKLLEVNCALQNTLKLALSSLYSTIYYWYYWHFDMLRLFTSKFDLDLTEEGKKLFERYDPLVASFDKNRIAKRASSIERSLRLKRKAIGFLERFEPISDYSSNSVVKSGPTSQTAVQSDVQCTSTDSTTASSSNGEAAELLQDGFVEELDQMTSVENYEELLALRIRQTLRKEGENDIKLDPDRMKETIRHWSSSMADAQKHSERRIDVALNYWYLKAASVGRLLNEIRSKLQSIDTWLYSMKELGPLLVMSSPAKLNFKNEQCWNVPIDQYFSRAKVIDSPSVSCGGSQESKSSSQSEVDEKRDFVTIPKDVAKVLHTYFALTTLETLHNDSSEPFPHPISSNYCVKPETPTSSDEETQPVGLLSLRSRIAARRKHQLERRRSLERRYNDGICKLTVPEGRSNCQDLTDEQNRKGFRGPCPVCGTMLVHRHPSLGQFILFRCQHIFAHKLDLPFPGATNRKTNFVFGRGPLLSTQHDECYFHAKAPTIFSIFQGRSLTPRRQKELIQYFTMALVFEQMMIKQEILMRFEEGSLHPVEHKRQYWNDLYDFIIKYKCPAIRQQIEKLIEYHEMIIKCKKNKLLSSKFCKKRPDQPLKLLPEMDEAERESFAKSRPTYPYTMVTRKAARRKKLLIPKTINNLYICWLDAANRQNSLFRFWEKFKTKEKLWQVLEFGKERKSHGRDRWELRPAECGKSDDSSNSTYEGSSKLEVSPSSNC